MYEGPNLRAPGVPKRPAVRNRASFVPGGLVGFKMVMAGVPCPAEDPKDRRLSLGSGPTMLQRRTRHDGLASDRGRPLILTDRLRRLGGQHDGRLQQYICLQFARMTATRVRQCRWHCRVDQTSIGAEDKGKL